MRPPRPQPKPAPARIWGFVASEAPKIVLLRRGPSKWTQMWLWNTETDEFEAGSWFAGHIYYLGCDLAPDGQHFIYHAANESKSKLESARQKFGIDGLYDWTTFCSPPYFKSCGTWTYDVLTGGGYFKSCHELALPSSKLRKVLVELSEKLKVIDAENNMLPFIIGMQRTGWEGFRQRTWPDWHTGSVKKGRLHLNWQDQLSFSVSKVHTYTYSYPAADLSGVSWADLDQQGRLVYARHGCVYRHTETGAQLLADLNASQPPRPWLEQKAKEKTAPEGGSLLV